MYLSFYCNVWDRTETAIYWPHSYGHERCVFLVLQGCSTGGPEAHSAGFVYCILSPTGLQNSIGGPEGPFGLVWLSLSHLVSNSVRSLTRAFSTTSYQQLLWTPTVWLPVLTKLYDSSTPTQSPTQFLEWHVWSSSSGNNCHAVQRSLSSGASVYECIMGFFTLSHFISQIRPRDLFRLLAIGMCHFLPAHHFRMACLAGSKVKIQQNNLCVKKLLILNWIIRS